jgi:hypothetical protein
MEHPFFSGVDWHAIYKQRIQPPFSPGLVGDSLDTRYFDEQFTAMPVQHSPWCLAFLCCCCCFVTPPYIDTAANAARLSRQITASIQAQTRMASHSRADSRSESISELFRDFTYEEPAEYLSKSPDEASRTSF